MNGQSSPKKSWLPRPAFATVADENNASVTIVNNEHGDDARDTSVTIAVPKGIRWTKVMGIC
jgi:hypothetical protein